MLEGRVSTLCFLFYSYLLHRQILKPQIFYIFYTGRLLNPKNLYLPSLTFLKKRSRKITATFLDKQKSEFLQFGMTSLTSLIFKSCQFLNFSSNILMTGKALSPPSRKKSLGKNYNVTTQSFLLIYIFKTKWQLPSLSQGFPKFHTQIRDLMVGLQAN